MPPPRLYLDHAATSWPKPEAVYAAMDRYARECGAPAGRGAYGAAAEAGRIVAQARANVAKLLNVPKPERVIFTANCTDALHLALHGMLRANRASGNACVVTTDAEHNSVLRPLHQLFLEGSAAPLETRVDGAGFVDLKQLEQALTTRPKPRLLVVNLASNVTGALNSLADVSALARAAGVRLLVDAAQAVGYTPIDLTATPVDFLAAPGHKGMLGPLGTGVLVLGEGMEEELQPVRLGGTGSQSELPEMPKRLPDRYEAGNLNVGGLAGLTAGVQHVLDEGVERIEARMKTLSERFLAALRDMSHVRIFPPLRAEHRVPVFSLVLDTMDPHEAAMTLDSAFGIEVRSGLHCAPKIHQRIGSAPQGTLRISFGHTTTEADVDRVTDAIAQLK